MRSLKKQVWTRAARFHLYAFYLALDACSHVRESCWVHSASQSMDAEGHLLTTCMQLTLQSMFHLCCNVFRKPRQSLGWN